MSKPLNKKLTHPCVVLNCYWEDHWINLFCIKPCRILRKLISDTTHICPQKFCCLPLVANGKWTAFIYLFSSLYNPSKRLTYTSHRWHLALGHHARCHLLKVIQKHTHSCTIGCREQYGVMYPSQWYTTTLPYRCYLNKRALPCAAVIIA